MAITLQQIADLAGVSRGTVDRALNNRGRIKPEVGTAIDNAMRLIEKENPRLKGILPKNFARPSLSLSITTISCQCWQGSHHETYHYSA